MAKDRIIIAERKLALAEQRSKFRESNMEVKTAKITAKQLAATRSEARAQMVRMKTLCPHGFVTALRNLAYLLAATRQSALSFADVACPNVTAPNAGGHAGLYTLACYPDDRATITAYATTLMSTEQSTSTSIADQTQARLAAALAELDAQGSLPDGRS